MTHSATLPPLTVGAPLVTGAPQSSLRVSPAERGINPEVILLIGGYVDESGGVHDEVELATLTGHDEYALAECGAQAGAATFITELLTRCVKRIGSLTQIDASLVRELLVGDRDYLAIKLHQMIVGARVNCVLRCASSDCGRLMDLTLNLDELEFEPQPIKQRRFTMPLAGGAEAAETAIDFRLPNGADQEACAALATVDEEHAVHQLLVRCIQRIGDCKLIDRSKIQELRAHGQLDEIDERMGQLAPRAEIELEATCPECGNHFDADFDVLAFLLDELRRSFLALEHDIHFLAWNYHWSEQEIIGMTQSKRRRYVALLQGETDRLNLNQVW